MGVKEEETGKPGEPGAIQNLGGLTTPDQIPFPRIALFLADEEWRIRSLEDQRYIEQIAAITGIPPEEIKPEEVAVLYGYVQTQMKFTEEVGALALKYLGPRANPAEEQLYTENHHQFSRYAGALFDIFDLPFRVTPSYGLFMPFYKDAIKEYRQRSALKRIRHTALLVGPASFDSIYEFNMTVGLAMAEGLSEEDRFGEKFDIAMYAIALAASEKMRRNVAATTKVHLQIGNFLGLPDLDPESFDSVHTNTLLTQLYDEEGKVRFDSTTRIAFFEQVYNHLMHEGRYIGVEVNVSDGYIETLYKDLARAGFPRKNVAITYPARFNSPRDTDRYRRLPDVEGIPKALWMIHSDQQIHIHGSIGIITTKP